MRRSLARNARVREFLELLTGHAEYRPFSHRHRAKFFVKIDRRLVPIQHRPFQPTATPLRRQFGDITQQSAAEAAPTERFIDVEVFDINPWLAKECRITVKEEHKAHRLLLEIAEHHFGGAPPAEKRFPENLLS